MRDERKGRPRMSRMARLSDCPGSLAAEADVPEPPQSTGASMGTRCHAAMETGNDDALNDDERKGVEMARDLEAATVETWLDGLPPKQFFRDPVAHRERRLWGVGESISGKADVVHSVGNHSLVIDYKFGRDGAEHATGNLQLRGLAVLEKENFPETDSVTVAIIQPGCNPQISVCGYDAEALVIARAEVQGILTAANEPNAPRRPSASACRYCKAAATCPEAQATALSVVYLDTPDLPAEQLPDLLALAKVAEQVLGARIDAIRGRARELLATDPEAVPGWELRHGRLPRSVPDTGAAFEQLAAVGLIDAGAMLKATKVSVPALEKAAAKHAGITQKDAKHRIADALGDLLETKTGAPILAAKKGNA